MAEIAAVNLDVILTAAFWANERSLLRRVLMALCTDVILDGVEWGARALIDVGLGAPVADVIGAAMRYAETMTDRMLDVIAVSNRDGTGQIIRNWIAAGEDLPTLLRRLKRAGIQNAEMTGITEVTRAFSAGQRIVWDQAGTVEGRYWHTVGDDRVCPICMPLDGKFKPLQERYTRITRDADGNEVDTGETVGSLAAKAGVELNPFGDPPAHTRCRCIMLPKVLGFEEPFALFRHFVDVGLLTPAGRPVLARPKGRYRVVIPRREED